MATRDPRAASEWSRSVVTILIAILLGGCSSARSTQFDQAIAESRAQVDRLMQANAIPGVAVAVTVGDRIVWLDGMGVKRDAQFRVGSVSKVITAAALMRLVDAGRVKLDAPVSLYLPSFPHGEITVGQLAGHLGGIRHYTRSEFLNREHYESATASLTRFANDPLVTTPGEKYAYSSYGFNVIGAIIESATKQRFDAAMTSLVFKPLGMRETSFSELPTAVRWYMKGNDGTVRVAPDVDLSDRWPSGGMLSTARDLGHFAIGITKGGFLTSAARDAMFASQKTNDGKETNVGIAWRMATDSDGRRFVHHGGEAMGARAFILLYPAERVSVAFVSNLSFAPFSEKEAGEIARRFLPRR